MDQHAAADGTVEGKQHVFMTALQNTDQSPRNFRMWPGPTTRQCSAAAAGHSSFLGGDTEGHSTGAPVRH